MLLYFLFFPSEGLVFKYDTPGKFQLYDKALTSGFLDIGTLLL